MASGVPPGRIRLSVTVPAGMGPGRQLRVQNGPRQFDVTIPPGVSAGQQFLMEIAAPPPTAAPPVAEAIPMGLPLEMEAPARGGGAAATAPPGASLQRRQSETTGRFIVEANPRSQAEMKAECPICFEPLCAAPVGVFLGTDGKRTSQHFFNLEAAREWLQSGTGMCPLTRKPIRSVLEVPDLRSDPEGWFKAVDMDGDQRLSRAEIVEALKAQLSVDMAALDAAAADPEHWMWQAWDTDGSGYVERAELLQPQGLVAYVRSAFERAQQDAEAIPDIMRDKDAWYRYWDEDNSNALDKEEVVRALLKTFRMTSDQAKVQQMRNTIDAIWPIFDDDNSGVIERDEFLKPNDGLADTIIATLGLEAR
jgi:Ca2+-binding EF-hand superfamily protein